MALKDQHSKIDNLNQPKSTTLQFLHSLDDTAKSSWGDTIKNSLYGTYGDSKLQWLNPLKAVEALLKVPADLMDRASLIGAEEETGQEQQRIFDGAIKGDDKTTPASTAQTEENDVTKTRVNPEELKKAAEEQAGRPSNNGNITISESKQPEALEQAAEGQTASPSSPEPKEEDDGAGIGKGRIEIAEEEEVEFIGEKVADGNPEKLADLQAQADAEKQEPQAQIEEQESKAPTQESLFAPNAKPLSKPRKAIRAIVNILRLPYVLLRPLTSPVKYFYEPLRDFVSEYPLTGSSVILLGLGLTLFIGLSVFTGGILPASMAAIAGAALTVGANLAWMGLAVGIIVAKLAFVGAALVYGTKLLQAAAREITGLWEDLRPESVEKEPSPNKPAALDMHWYEDHEITDLLDIIGSEHPNTYMFTPIEGEYLENLAPLVKQQVNQTQPGVPINLVQPHRVLTELKSYQEQRVNEAIKQEQGEDSQPGTLLYIKDHVFIPINKGSNHWVLLYLEYSNNIIKQVSYFDSMGKGPSSELVAAVKNAFSKYEIEVEDISKNVQSDNYNCGVWVVWAIENLIKAGGVPTDNSQINQQRSIQQQSLKDYRQKKAAETAERKQRQLEEKQKAEAAKLGQEVIEPQLEADQTEQSKRQEQEAERQRLEEAEHVRLKVQEEERIAVYNEHLSNLSDEQKKSLPEIEQQDQALIGYLLNTYSDEVSLKNDILKLVEKEKKEEAKNEDALPVINRKSLLHNYNLQQQIKDIMVMMLQAKINKTKSELGEEISHAEDYIAEASSVSKELSNNLQHLNPAFDADKKQEEEQLKYAQEEQKKPKQLRKKVVSRDLATALNLNINSDRQSDSVSKLREFINVERKFCQDMKKLADLLDKHKTIIDKPDNRVFSWFSRFLQRSTENQGKINLNKVIERYSALGVYLYEELGDITDITDANFDSKLKKLIPILCGYEFTQRLSRYIVCIFMYDYFRSTLEKSLPYLKDILSIDEGNCLRDYPIKPLQKIAHLKDLVLEMHDKCSDNNVTAKRRLAILANYVKKIGIVANKLQGEHENKKSDDQQAMFDSLIVNKLLDTQLDRGKLLESLEEDMKKLGASGEFEEDLFASITMSVPTGTDANAASYSSPTSMSNHLLDETNNKSDQNGTNDANEKQELKKK